MIWALYPNRKDDVKRKTTQFDIFIKNFFYKTRSVDYACETSNCHTFCPTIRSQNLPHLLPISKTENNKNCPRERLATCGANFSFATTCSLTVYFAIACFFHSVFCRQYVLPTVFLTTLYLTHGTFCRAPFFFAKENSVRQSALQNMSVLPHRIYASIL